MKTQKHLIDREILLIVTLWNMIRFETVIVETGFLSGFQIIKPRLFTKWTGEVGKPKTAHVTYGSL